MPTLLALLILLLTAWTAQAQTLSLTDAERKWLHDHPELRLGVDASWPPFEYRDADGHYQGLAADYITLLKEELGVEIRLVEPQNWSKVLEQARQGKLDLLPGVMSTPDRQQYLAFTRPYLDFPIVILAHRGGAQPRNLQDLYGLKVAVVADYAPHELLRNQHPDLNLVALPNVSSALQALATDQVDAMVGDLASSVWSLRQLKLEGVYVSGETPYRYQLAMAVPREQAPLVAILDKALANLPPGEVDAIQERWVGNVLDHRAIWRDLMLYGLPTLAALMLILAVVIRINRRLSSEIARRINLEQALRSSEYHFRGMVENLSAIAWEAEYQNFTYSYVSPHAEDLLGYPLSQWLLPGFRERIVHPDDVVRVHRFTTRESQARRDFTLDYRVLTQDGRYIWVRDIVNLLEHTPGHPVLRGLMIDISEIKRTEEALRQSEEKFAKAFHASPDGMLITRQSDGMLLEVNRGFSRLSGHSAESSLAHSTVELGLWVYPHERERMLFELKRDGFVHDYRCHVRRRDGQERLCEISATPMPIGGSDCMLTIARDITERQLMQEKLQLAATVFESTAEGVLITDTQQRISAVNRAFSEITGYSEQQALGQTPRLLASGQHDSAFYLAMWHQLEEEGHWQGEICNKRRNGELYPSWLTISAVRNATRELTHYVAVFADISSLKQAQARLDYQAHHDPLTGLPNRALFETRLQSALASQEGQAQGAVLFLDLDRFKHINDSLGHPVGDLLLKGIAQRLKEQVRDIDTVARLGGDEFIILLPGIQNPDDAAHIAHKVLTCFAAPFQAGEHEFFTSASIGVSRYPMDGSDVATLVKNADAAMYRSKAKGRNRVEAYTRDLTAQASERVAMENELRRAIERNELSLMYQPKFSLRDQQLVGAEALLRWHHPNFGEVTPERFIPLAEENGLILPISDWVMEQACRQLRDWNRQYKPFGPLAVNIAGAQLRQPLLVDRIEGLLNDYNLRPGSLQLEITENFIMSQAEEALDILHRLKRLGLQLAIDDFGTGYSSLSYLKRLPLDILKIDQSFVRGLPDDANDAAIVRAIMALARSMQLTAIAEGVENQDQQAFLAREGCEQIQGFIVSLPLTAREFAVTFLRTIHSDLTDSTTEKPSL